MAAVLHFEVKIVELSRVMREEPDFFFHPPWYSRSTTSQSQSGDGVHESFEGPAPFRTELKGKTVGIIGLGSIGKQVVMTFLNSHSFSCKNTKV